jgi:IPT/TIG domain-containing protein
MKRLFIRQTGFAIVSLIVLGNLFSCSKSSKETGPVITGLSADTAWIGKTITINGSGFSATASGNTVRIGNTVISDILEATTEALTFKVPAATTSGKVYVSVDNRETSGPRELIIVNQLDWQKALGGSMPDYGIAVAPSSDGGYLLAGYSQSTDGDVNSNHGSVDMWVVKLNGNRSIAWQKVLGGSGDDFASSIVALADGGCVVAGYTTSNDGDVAGNHGSNDYWIIKLNAAGNVVWKSILGGSGSDVTTSIVATATGYAVAGYTSSTDGNVSGNHGNNDYWVVWLDVNGALIRQKTYGGTVSDQAWSITSTQEGGYLVAGKASSTNGDVTANHGSYDFWVLKLNAAGDIEWQKSLGGSRSETARSIIAASDGSSIVAGYSTSIDGDVTGSHGSTDMWVVKLNANGTIAWQKSLGGAESEQAMQVTPAKNGGCTIGGYTTSSDGDVTSNHGANDSWIVRLNATGSVVWQKTLGGTNTEGAFSIAATGNSFVALGVSDSPDGDVTGLHGDYDLWLFKIWD